MVYIEITLLSLHPKGYIMTELSKYIKEKRKEPGLTQVDLSQNQEQTCVFLRKLGQTLNTKLLKTV